MAEYVAPRVKCPHCGKVNGIIELTTTTTVACGFCQGWFDWEKELKHQTYYNLLEEAEKIRETPYFNEDRANKVVDALDHFVNGCDQDDFKAFVAKIHSLDDSFVKEYMEEQGITFPETADEAHDREVKLVAAGLQRLHRTLNQDFMRIVLAFIRIQAAAYDAGVFDARNEDSVRICKMLQNFLKEHEDEIYLPRV